MKSISIIYYSVLIILFTFGCSYNEPMHTHVSYNKATLEKIAIDLQKKLTHLLSKKYYDSLKISENYYLLGYCNTELENFEKALDHFQIAQQFSSNHTNDIADYKTYLWGSNVNRGISAFNENNLQAAKKFFNISLLFNPGDSLSNAYIDLIQDKIKIDVDFQNSN